MAIPIEYQQVLDQYNKMYDERRQVADAQALKEAQRRGLVGQTGTSSVESLMRMRAGQPIEQARAQSSADLMAQAASEALRQAEQEKQRQWQTGERTSAQGWQTGEREAGQGWQTGERIGTQDFTALESQRQKDFEKTMNEYLQNQAMSRQQAGQQDEMEKLKLQREWMASDQRKKSRDWWKDAAGSLLGGIGSGIGGLFCFDPETLIDMADGSKKKIRYIEVGDETLGGKVISKRAAQIYDGEMYHYLGVFVTGMHAVKENGIWKRVANTDFGFPVVGERIVNSLITTDHRVYANGITFADEIEHDDASIPLNDSIELLNKQESINSGN